MVLDLPGGNLDLDDGVFRRADGVAEPLTDIERRVLRYLAERAGRAVARDELLREVWGYRAGVLSRTVFTTVGRIRAKIEADPARPRHLLTAPGEGYLFALDEQPRRRAPRGPLQATPFVGRGELLAELDAVVSRARLVSLLGPGGVGKTRLAQELLGRREGVFVALEPVDEVGRVPAAVAAALGATLSAADAWPALSDLVGGEALLVVLDNAEHLAGLADRVGVWLAACPGLTLLVTSRVRLGLRLEVALVVRPLGLPRDAATLEESEAGALLLAHAARVRPGWVPDEAEAGQLVALCVRVGGSPLALELAASWLRVLEPTDLLQELEGATPLAALDHDVPARHRSMDVALDASWRLLAPGTARVLEALAVFCTPFDRAAAQAVAGAELLTLGQLVDASMVHRVGARFDLHPLVRADARARLAGVPARAQEVAARHARWVLLGHLEGTAVEDVLAAWEHAVVDAHVDLLAASAYPLYRALDRRNRHADLIRAMRRAADMVGDPGLRAALGLLGAGAGAVLDVPPREVVGLLDGVPTPLRAAARVHAAIVVQLAGDLELAIELAANAVADAGGDRDLVAFARSVGGTAWLRAGRLDRAREELLASIDEGDDRLTGRPMVHLGEVELAAGRLPEARDVLAAALDHCRRADDLTFATLAAGRLGHALATLGEDPGPTWLAAIEEARAGRLPRVWWAAALIGLGSRWAEAGVLGGVELLAAAAAGATMEPPGVVEAKLTGLRDRWPPAVWAGAVRRGRGWSDAEVFACLRGIAGAPA